MPSLPPGFGRREIGNMYPHTLAVSASRGLWVAYDHLKYISAKCASVICEGDGRLIVNMGPRQGKSELISHWVPAWFLELWPHKRVLLLTAEGKLAKRYGGDVRDEFESNPYFRTKLKGDTTEKAQWETTAGGGMKAVGVDTATLGSGGDLLIIDDPYGSWTDAWSTTYRGNLETWFRSTVNTRIEPGATIIVLHHRMHPKDLTGWLLESGEFQGWEHVCLPSIARENDPLGRTPGQALCPQRFDETALELRRAGMGQVIFDAMHQQNPQHAGPGCAYHRFAQQNIRQDLELDPKRPLHFSIDFNSTPCMHIMLGQHDERAGTLTDVWELTGARDLNRALTQFSEWVKAQGGFKWPELHIFGDPAGSGRNMQSGISDFDLILSMMRSMGIKHRLRVAPHHPRIVARAAAMNDALADIDGKPHYLVHPRCTAMLEDLRAMQTDKDGEPASSDMNRGHASAAAGYRVHFLRPVGGGAMMPTGGRFIAR